MARNGDRKKKNNGERESKVKVSSLKSETIGWIAAICLGALSVFLVLASVGEEGKAGPAGREVYSILKYLFGIGYFLLPILSVILAVAFARSYIRPVTKLQGLGAFIFFVASLAFVDLSLRGQGGVVGAVIVSPLIKLFDVYATAVILICLISISVLVIFDAPLNIGSIFSIFRKKDSYDEDEPEESEDNEPTIIGADLGKETYREDRPVAPVLKKEPPQNNEFGDLRLNSKSYAGSKPFTPPPLSLLEKDRGKPGVGDIKANANLIKRTLQNFGIIVEMDEISIGPSVTRYALKPAEGVKLSKILGLQNNLELALAAHPVRIEAPIPGKSLVGIEIPNSTKTTVGLATLLSDNQYQSSDKSLMVALGKGISGEALFANLAKMPHALIAGATGSGKSVTIHALINSLLFRNPPSNLKFIMVDPKRVELTLYNKIPHLLTPVLTDPKKAITALKWAAKEMERRYNVLEKNKVRDIESYHKNIYAPSLEKNKNTGEENDIENMPYIVVIIDELADIMQAYPRELESAIVRLAQMSRAVGIHLVLSTQRPSVNVITGLIKANVPARIAMQVASQIDSRTILDTSGAEKLLGAGDMLYISGEMSKPVRLQSPYISETEVKKVVDYLAKEYEDEVPSEINLNTERDSGSVSLESSLEGDDDEEDELYKEAKDIVVRAGRASTSFLQRKLRIGYARAARLIDILEDRGIIGAGDGAKPREVLVKPEGGFDESLRDEEFEDDDFK